MQPERRIPNLLRDMRDYALQAQRLAASGSPDVMTDTVVRLAMERSLEIVGEAANQLPAAYRQSNPQVPWHQIIGMRNVLVHGYASVDAGILWRTVTERVPELLAQLDVLISASDDESQDADGKP